MADLMLAHMCERANWCGFVARCWRSRHCFDPQGSNVIHSDALFGLLQDSRSEMMADRLDSRAVIICQSPASSMYLSVKRTVHYGPRVNYHACSTTAYSCPLDDVSCRDPPRI